MLSASVTVFVRPEHVSFAEKLLFDKRKNTYGDSSVHLFLWFLFKLKYFIEENRKYTLKHLISKRLKIMVDYFPDYMGYHYTEIILTERANQYMCTEIKHVPNIQSTKDIDTIDIEISYTTHYQSLHHNKAMEIHTIHAAYIMIYKKLHH